MPSLIQGLQKKGTMDALEAIYSRRAVRSYERRKVEKGAIVALIDAAIQAPSAMNQQPWAFVVVQDAALLARWSREAKIHVLATLDPAGPFQPLRETLADPAHDIFYGATTLIVVCSRAGGLNPQEDCCLAAQNLMIAACAMGLATCPIGLARDYLNQPEARRELGIPDACSVVLPILLGYPHGTTPPVPRRQPEILCWR
jgi:nitroreductase